jgi:hypothetical protein
VNGLFSPKQVRLGQGFRVRQGVDKSPRQALSLLTLEKSS